MKYFEDIEEGAVWHLGSRVVEEAEIVAFARKYDPQPFHIDAAAAKQTPIGELIASGWHTCAIFMNLLADYIQGQGFASLGAPGIESCRWLAPVRPGDTLTGRATVLHTRLSRSKPYGLAMTRTELFNQHDDPVLRIEGIGLYGLRPHPAAQAAT